MSTLLAHLRRAAPIALPIAVLLLAWVAVIRPIEAAQARDAVRVVDLRARLAAVQPLVQEPSPGSPSGMDAADAFEAFVSADDGTSRLLRAITRVASSAGVRHLFVDSTAAPINIAAAGGPRVEDAPRADPRLALFETPLAYTAIPISFDGTYAALGDFLWQLRELPAVVEIRELTVSSAADSRDPATGAATPSAARRARTHDGTVSVSMMLFVYARQAGEMPFAVEGGRR